LRPIYDALVAAATRFGDDVELGPRKTYVSLRRSKQFGIIKPATRTRVDVGIHLPDAEASDRLQPGKSFGGMCSHQVAVTDAGQVDTELVGWLKAAYERS
jgi:predicted transport protein